MLRWYLAEEDLLDGNYEYPVVMRQAAITGSGNGPSMPTSTSSGTAPATYSGSASGGKAENVQSLVLSVLFAYVLVFCC